jgi:hypothetical protein
MLKHRDRPSDAELQKLAQWLVQPDGDSKNMPFGLIANSNGLSFQSRMGKLS